MNNKIKIGKLVRNAFQDLFDKNKLPKEEIANLMDNIYSKKVFNVNYSILKERILDNKTNQFGKDRNGHSRYYQKDLYAEKYLLCSQWNKWDEKLEPLFMEWLKKYNT